MHVVRKGQPAQIAGSVVQCVAVDVIHRSGSFGVRVCAKGLRHKTTDQEMSGLSILRQRHSWIALVVRERCQEPCFWMLEALDASHVADKVLAIVAYDFLPQLIGKVHNRVYRYHSFLKLIQGFCPSIEFEKSSKWIIHV